MKCVHINIRKATFIVLSLLINNITITQMADNHMDLQIKEPKKNISNSDRDLIRQKMSITDEILHCPSNKDCSELAAFCLNCQLNSSCIYGNSVSATCSPKPMVKCKGHNKFMKQFICRFCYQTESWEHSCELRANCNSVASPPTHYASNCTVNDDILCLGNRNFNKKIQCNWTGGYRWKTALVLSITLGGFGADRFYLGHWQEGIGKLFSFGGLGVWTIVDVILISLHYLGPADGSLYI